jgi:hypothetical protein
VESDINGQGGRVIEMDDGAWALKLWRLWSCDLHNTSAAPRTKDVLLPTMLLNVLRFFCC